MFVFPPLQYALSAEKSKKTINTIALIIFVFFMSFPDNNFRIVFFISIFSFFFENLSLPEFAD